MATYGSPHAPGNGNSIATTGWRSVCGVLTLPKATIHTAVRSTRLAWPKAVAALKGWPVPLSVQGEPIHKTAKNEFAGPTHPVFLSVSRTRTPPEANPPGV
jgi:hypothetical protein